MNNLNSTIVEGNAVRKPEIRKTPKGTSICTLPLAVNRYYKNSSGSYEEEVSYFDVESYGKLAEFCASLADKGRGIRVVGRLKQNRWKSSDGKSFSKVYIIAEHLEFKPVKKNGISQEKTQSKDADLSEIPSPEEQLAEAHQVLAEETVF